LLLVQKARGNGLQQKTIKKRKIIFPFFIIEFFGKHQLYNKTNLVQHEFLEDIILYITKGYHPLSSIENPWLRRMILRQHLCVVFAF
jgi:hypothetical protein